MQRHENSAVEMPQNKRAVEILIAAAVPKKFKFAYRKIDQVHNMVINQLSQYLTISDTTEHIEKIHRGVCMALSKYYIAHQEDYEAHRLVIQTWDGKPETITPLLSDILTRLYAFFLECYDQPNLRAHVVVDNLDQVFLLKKSFVITNHNHACAVVYDENDASRHWQVFDPNYRDSKARFGTTEEAKAEIYKQLGPCLSVHGISTVKPKINNPASFIRLNGLGVLFTSQVIADENIQAIVNHTKHFTKEDFVGLFNLGFEKTPFWLLDKHNEYKALIINLIHQFSLQVTYEDLFTAMRNSLSQMQLATVKSELIKQLNLTYKYKISVSDDALRLYQTLLLHICQSYNYFTVPHTGKVISTRTLMSKITFTDQILETAYVLNPTLFMDFFDRGIFGINGNVTKKAGIIRAHRNCTLLVKLTRSLHNMHWVNLVDACAENNVKLIVQMGANIQALADPSTSEPTLRDHARRLFSYPVKAPLTSAHRHEANPHIKILQTNDTDALITNYEQHDRIIIDVTNFTAFDIIEKLYLPMPPTGSYALTKSLNGLFGQDQLIIFRGEFSDELIDMLAPWLIDNNKTSPTNKVIFLIDSATNFDFVNVQTVRISGNQKATIIHREFPENVYAQLNYALNIADWENTSLVELRRKAEVIQDQLSICLPSYQPGLFANAHVICDAAAAAAERYGNDVASPRQ